MSKVQDVLSLSAIAGDIPKIICDSNILFPFVDKKHKSHGRVKMVINNLYHDGVTFYYVLPCLLELKQYWRKKRFSEAVEERYLEDYPFFKKFRKAYEPLRPKVASGTYLNEDDIKTLRDTLIPIAEGKGVKMWLGLCKEALDGEFQMLESILQETNFLYARFDDDDVFPKSAQADWPAWQDADKLIEQYCLGSADAAILNMTNRGAGIKGLLTQDGDLHFVAENSGLSPGIVCYTFP